MTVATPHSLVDTSSAGWAGEVTPTGIPQIRTCASKIARASWYAGVDWERQER